MARKEGTGRMRASIISGVMSGVMAIVLLTAGGAARADWTALRVGAAAPIRSITRRADGLLLGPRSSGHTIEVWASASNGLSWTRRGSVVNNANIDYGDPTMLAIPGTDTVFCAFREATGGTFRVTVWRSDNGGDTWAFDSTVAGPYYRFVGAPFLILRGNGDLQCYYDSEQLAADNGRSGYQWVAMQGRAGTTGPWSKYGLVTASREANPAVLTRDGMPTVVSLGSDRLMCVTEGVETQGHGASNIIRYIESWDGGATWDYAHRAIAYQCRIDPATNRQYNAYAPCAIRVGNGPVWVAFCSDEDETGAPDVSSTPPGSRHSHIKVVQTTDIFEHWSAPTPVWTQNNANYAPVLFERSANNVLATLDLFAGHQAVLTNLNCPAPPFHVADAMRAVAVASGLVAPTPTDAGCLDIEATGGSMNRLDLRDAVRLLRKAAGLEANP